LCPLCHPLASCLDAFSSREPVPTSLENALDLDRDDAFLASHLNSLEPVYVGFSAPRTTNLGNLALLSKIAISCRE
jgi:hypothetical protein